MSKKKDVPQSGHDFLCDWIRALERRVAVLEAQNYMVPVNPRDHRLDHGGNPREPRLDDRRYRED